MIRDVEKHLLNPPPGSARGFGTDLTLTLQRLRLTPTERLRQLRRAMIELENMRGLARQTSKADDSSRADVTAADTTRG